MLQNKCKHEAMRLTNLIAFFTFLFFINACTKANVSVGTQLIGDEYSQIVMSDTFSVNVSTVYIDSFITSATGSGLAGSYNDNAFGQVNVSSYYQFKPPSFSDQYVAYDSLELIIKCNGNYYGDSTKPLQLNVYRLSNLISKTYNTSFYNYDAIPYFSTPIGGKTFQFYPSITDTISFRLSDVLGNQLLQLLKDSTQEVTSPDNFVNYFNGITIVPQQTNAFVFGFKDSVIMRLHYHETSDVLSTSKIADFTLYNNQRQFNHIDVNRTGTSLATLNMQTIALPSFLTNNAGYTQPATNCVAKIRMPTIRDLFTIPNYLKIERALLIIKPVVGTYTGFYTLPDSLRLTTTDINNSIFSDLTFPTGTVQYGSFVRDYLYEQNTQYSYDVTNYVISQLGVASANENGFLLRLANNTQNVTSFKRVIIGDQQNKISPIKLQLYYLTVK